MNFIIKLLVHQQEFSCHVHSELVFLMSGVDAVNGYFHLCLPTVTLMKKEKM